MMSFSGGDVYCVASVVAGNNTFVVVYNAESTVDNSNTFRFSCLVRFIHPTAAFVTF